MSASGQQWIEYWVRETPPSERFPTGVPKQKLGAWYSAEERKLMAALRKKALAAPDGSQERQEALNELAVVHELKALCDAEIVTEAVAGSPKPTGGETDDPF